MMKRISLHLIKNLSIELCKQKHFDYKIQQITNSVNLLAPIQFDKTELLGKSQRLCQIVSSNPQSPCYRQY